MKLFFARVRQIFHCALNFHRPAEWWARDNFGCYQREIYCADCEKIFYEWKRKDFL